VLAGHAVVVQLEAVAGVASHRKSAVGQSDGRPFAWSPYRDKPWIGSRHYANNLAHIRVLSSNQSVTGLTD
jgi:hypothetical protein